MVYTFGQSIRRGNMNSYLKRKMSKYLQKKDVVTEIVLSPFPFQLQGTSRERKEKGIVETRGRIEDEM